jgi:Phytanoyl-CoA dioxygenase (PhyH)
MELAIPTESPAPLPLYRSRFGGLWTDRADAHDLLAARCARGELSDEATESLAQYIDEGYVIFRGEVDPSLVDEYVSFFERSWDDPPPLIYLHWQRQLLPMDRRLYDEVTKVADLHCYFGRAGELVFPRRVLRFLAQIFERTPVVFQTMSMRKGSEENLHIDTGPLTLSEPMALAASWLALEDIDEGSGVFEFIPGSHQLPELLHQGVGKGHKGNFEEYDRVLQRTVEMCTERGLTTKRFLAKKGDVLVWHADLMHGGAAIENKDSTRRSLVAHFMPLGVMPTWYDFSQVKAWSYPNGGCCLDSRYTCRDLNRQAAAYGNDIPAQEPHAIETLRRLIPASLRQRMPASVRSLVRDRLAR